MPSAASIQILAAVSHGGHTGRIARIEILAGAKIHIVEWTQIIAL